jgi:hypothetical protein
MILTSGGNEADDHDPCAFAWEVRRILWERGFLPVAVFSREKRPKGLAWPERARRDPPDAVISPATRDALNTGIIADGLRPLDLDVNDDDICHAVVEMIVTKLGPAPSRYRSNAARRLLLYRAAIGEPPKASVSGPHGKLEVLGRGQQFVAAGFHPSGARLEWTRSPMEINRDDLIAVTEEQVAEVLAAAAVILGAQPVARRRAPSEMPVFPDAGDEAPPTAEILDLLGYVSADCGYQEWISVLMAIHAATGGAGVDIADAWSAGAPHRYPGRREIETKWRSFRRDGITIATLAEMAQRNGADVGEIARRHRPPSPAPDYSGLRVGNGASTESIDPETGEILDEAAPAAAENPSDFPDEFCRPDGLVGDIAGWIADTTPEPVPVHALGAALCIVGTLIGRKVYSRVRPTGTHLYVAAIAPSGVGKQHTMTCIRELLNVIDCRGHHTGWHNSGPKFASVIQSHASIAVVVDEFSEKFAAISKPNAGAHQSAISEMFREMWGCSTAEFHAPGALGREDMIIKRPSMSFFGTSTIRDFKDNMSARDIANGLFNRILLLPRFSEVAIGPEEEGVLEIPPDILEQCRAMYHCLGELLTQIAICGNGYPDPIMLPFDDAAARANIENKAFEREMRRKADKDREYGLYARYAEQVKRIAMIIACGMKPYDLRSAVVTEEEMTFARRLVAWSIDQFRTMAARDMAENENQKNYIFVLDIVRSAGIIGRSALYHKVKHRMRKPDLDDLIEYLIEAGTIEKIEHKTDGEPGRKKRGPKSESYRYLKG